MYKIIYYLVVCTLLTSCHRTIVIQGSIKDKTTSEPISGAKIFLFNQNVGFSDSSGSFHSRIRIGMIASDNDPEVLILKQGYKFQYLDIGNSQKNVINNFNIFLEPGQTIQKLPRGLVIMFYLFNLLLSGINFATLVFIFKNSIENKWFWILGILCINLTIKINYIDLSSSFNFFNGPFSITSYEYSPLIIKSLIPIFTILFWSKYLRYGIKTAL